MNITKYIIQLDLNDIFSLVCLLDSDKKVRKIVDSKIRVNFVAFKLGIKSGFICSFSNSIPRNIKKQWSFHYSHFGCDGRWSRNIHIPKSKKITVDWIFG